MGDFNEAGGEAPVPGFYLHLHCFLSSCVRKKDSVPEPLGDQGPWTAAGLTCATLAQDRGGEGTAPALWTGSILGLSPLDGTYTPLYPWV